MKKNIPTTALSHETEKNEQKDQQSDPNNTNQIKIEKGEEDADIENEKEDSNEIKNSDNKREEVLP